MLRHSVIEMLTPSTVRHRFSPPQNGLANPGQIWYNIFLSARTLQKFIPHFKNKGRDGQRSLAMSFSAVGYLLGTPTAFLTGAPAELKILYLEYLLCGIAMLVLNKVFKRKASGHACGIVGPVLMMLYFRMFIPAVAGMFLILPVYVSSLKTKRHTGPQLLGGSLIPMAALGVIHLVYLLIK